MSAFWDSWGHLVDALACNAALCEFLFPVLSPSYLSMNEDIAGLSVIVVYVLCDSSRRFLNGHLRLSDCTYT